MAISSATSFQSVPALSSRMPTHPYPGLACDVPSHLHEFSFAPNGRWSRRYPPGREIQAYMETSRGARDAGDAQAGGQQLRRLAAEVAPARRVHDLVAGDPHDPAVVRVPVALLEGHVDDGGVAVHELRV